jgi:hypothetical protein
LDLWAQAQGASEGGCTAGESRSIMGHATLKEVALYTADAAMSKLTGKSKQERQ